MPKKKPDAPSPDERTPPPGSVLVGLAPISLEALERVEGGESLKENIPKRLVLSAIARMPSIPRAAKAAGVHQMTVYSWLGRVSQRQESYDPVFARAFDLCFEFGVQELEAVAQERALAYSDRLLMFLLRGYKQKVFGNADPDGDGTQGQAVSVRVMLHKGGASVPSGAPKPDEEK